ncbi:MAG: CapA family protein [Bacillota bacterium]|jgi:poly-gamma-glutamate synthesis protein (capsule biosynthesis protein)
MPARALAVWTACALLTFLAASPPATGPLLAAGDLSGPLFYTRIYLDGVRVPLPAPAVVAGGYTLAPARALFERLGATVSWEAESGRVLIESPGKRIELWLGRVEAAVDGEPVGLDAAPFLWGSTTMVPVRFVAETMGLAVEWDAVRWAVTLRRLLPAPGGGGAGPGGEPGGEEPETPGPRREVTVAFAGDVLLASSIGRSIVAHGPDYPWDGVRTVLAAADIAMVNLESCVSTRGTPVDKRWVFRAAPEALAGLKNAGVDIVSTANNHVFDYGLDAFLDTLAYLEQYGIRQVGSGRDLAAALSPVIMEAGGLRIAFLAATQWFVSAGVASSTRPGVTVTHYHEAALLETIRRLKERGEADYVAVSLHWGIEGDHDVDRYQERLGRALVDAGADMVIGHHPHVLQGIEIYKGKLIAYSLGNFVFTYTTRATMDSAVLLVTLDDQGLAAVQLIPVYTAGGRPVLEQGAGFERILREVERFSERWGTRIDPEGYVLFP